MQSYVIETKHLRTLLIGAAFLLMSFIPLSASAATRPTCTLTATTEGGEIKVTKEASILLKDGEDFEISWKSKNANEAELNGEEIDLSDSEEFSATTTTTYKFVFMNGSKKAVCEVTATIVEGKINSVSTSSNGKPTFSGEAEGLKKVQVAVYKEGARKPVWKKNVSVKRGEWRVKISKKLKPGDYEVRLMGDRKYDLNIIDTEAFTVTSASDSSNDDEGESNSTLTVGTLPLLVGGTIRAGETKPIIYLQLKNIGSEEVHVTGFTVKQNGTASTNAITSLSTVDDKGGSRGTSENSPFSNGSGFAPTDAILAPGAIKLFTIKATLGTNIAFGTNLKLDVTSVTSNGKEQGAFPLIGTTWTIGL